MDGAMTKPVDSKPVVNPRRTAESSFPQIIGDTPFSRTGRRFILQTASSFLVLGLLLPWVVKGQDGNAPSDTDSEPPLPVTEAPPELPPGFHPPRPVPEIVTMVKKLSYQRPSSSEKRTFTEMRRSGIISDRVVFDKVVKWMVYRLSDPKERPNLHKLRGYLLDVAINRSRGAFKTTYLDEIVKLLPDLFDNQLAVRVNAMLSMAYLRNERCIPAMTAEIEDPKQHPAVKHAAVMGIEIAPPLNQVSNRERVLRALVDLLKNDKIVHGWTRASAARALGKIREPKVRPLGKRTEVVEALMHLVTDPEGAKHYPHQCYASQAARAIGMLEIDPGLDVDFEEMSIEMGRLATRMGRGYLKDSQESDFPDANWKAHFQDLFLAFYGESDLPGSGLKNMAVGQHLPTVNEFGTLITDLYRMIADGESDESIRDQMDEITAKIAAITAARANEDNAGPIGRAEQTETTLTSGASVQ